MNALCKSIIRHCTKINIILVLGSVLLSNSVFANITQKSPIIRTLQPAVHATSLPDYLPYILMRSATDGSWKMVTNYTLPSDVSTQAMLSGVTCQKNNCIAVGNYGVRPLIMNSTDGGASWISLNSDKVQFNQNANSLSMNSPSCNTAVCILTGTYVLNSIMHLVILRNAAGSDIWTTVNQSNITFPSNYDSTKNAWITGSSCSGNLCVAVGYYNAVGSKTAADTSILILTSTDLGLHWTPNKGNILLPSDDKGNNKATGVICNGMSCTAIGSYSYNLDTKQYLPDYSPLVLNSNDGGQNWTSATINLPKGDGNIVGSFCDNTGCKAVGDYSNGDPTANFAPLILLTDTGKTIWNSVPSSYIRFPKDYSQYITLDATVCSTVFCVASGSYTNTASNDRPLILESDSTYNTWQGVDPENIQLPSDLTKPIVIGGIAFNSATFVAVGYYYRR